MGNNMGNMRNNRNMGESWFHWISHLSQKQFGISRGEYRTGFSQPVARQFFPKTQQTQSQEGQQVTGREGAKTESWNKTLSAVLLGLKLHAWLWLSSICVRSASAAVLCVSRSTTSTWSAGSSLWTGAKDSVALEKSRPCLVGRLPHWEFDNVKHM